MDKQNNEKTSFWGRPVKDEKGHVVAYKDEFGDVRTKKEIVNEGVGCLFVGLSVLALLGCVFARGCQEIKRRCGKDENKPVAGKVERALLYFPNAEKNK